MDIPSLKRRYDANTKLRRQHGFIHLPNTGILTLNPESAAYTSDLMLVAPSHNSITLASQFHIPNVDL